MQSKRTTRHRKYVERTCERCGAPYTTRADTKQTMCSVTCSRSTKTPRDCERCGATFVVPAASRQRYCSRPCWYGTDEQRFMSLFTASTARACWLWTGYRSGDYGRMRWRGGMTLAHRISWMFFVGPIPDGLLVLHKCPGGGNPRCVNPAHLALGDHQENADDMMKDGRHWSMTGIWSPAMGAASPCAVLTEPMVKDARRRVLAGESCKSIAAAWGCNQGTLTCAVKGQSWRHLTDPPPVRMRRGGGVAAG